MKVGAIFARPRLEIDLWSIPSEAGPARFVSIAPGATPLTRTFRSGLEGVAAGPGVPAARPLSAALGAGRTLETGPRIEPGLRPPPRRAGGVPGCPARGPGPRRSRAQPDPRAGPWWDSFN